MSNGPADSPADFSASDWELVKDLVYSCQTQPPADLDQFLRSRAPSEKVRSEVVRLLQASSDCGDFLHKSASEQHLGVSLHRPLRVGRFRVMDEIGSGGSGIVYAAWDESLNRKVALKVLRPDVAANAEFQKRLRWDARTASMLQHPNIVVVYEVGSDSGSDYIAMECIAGRTLSDCIKAGPLDTRTILRYAIQICGGVEAAHAAGIVHRDLKPGNIMITEQGAVKILDFGLAKDCDGAFDPKDAPETVEGRFAGTVAYVSPEQAEARSVDSRSDIFSFGSVLYEMLTGRQAFPGRSTVSILADILLKDPQLPHTLVAHVDSRFDEIVSRCLRKDRERRFQSISEVRVRLQELEEQILHPELHPARAPAPRRPLSVLIVCGAAIAAAAAGITWLALKPPPPADRNFRLTRMSADRGVTGSPALSKDGKLLAFASDRAGAGNLDIYVQHVNSSDATQLTTDPADDRDPVFSPDGSRIVFRSERDGGGLYSVSALGGSERRLFSGGHDARFSPDGKWIAWWTGEYQFNFVAGSMKVFVAPAIGGPAEQFQPSFAIAAFPIWSPESDRILFLASPPGATAADWWSAPYPGPGPAQKTGLADYWTKFHLNHLPCFSLLAPALWLPGNRLVFAATHVDSSNIWNMKVSPAGLPLDAPHRVTGGTSYEWHPSAAEADGKSLLAYEAMTTDSDIWQISLDGAGAGHSAAPPHLLFSGAAGISSPSISRDGSILVFSSKQPIQIGRESIRAIDLKTNRQFVVTNLASRNIPRPILSGDGKVVAYWADKSGYLIPTAGGDPRKVCTHCGPPTHVSFDGRSAIFEAATDPEQVMLASPGADPRPLIALDPPRYIRQSGARFSPDGRHIVFTTGNPDSPVRRVFVAPFHPGAIVTPSELALISEGESTDIEPVWSSTGQQVFFLSNRDGFRCIWARAVDVDGRPRGPAYAVAHFHKPGQALGGASQSTVEIGLSAGPGFLVFSMLHSTSDIWLRTEAAAH